MVKTLARLVGLRDAMNMHNDGSIMAIRQSDLSHALACRHTPGVPV